MAPNVYFQVSLVGSFLLSLVNIKQIEKFQKQAADNICSLVQGDAAFLPVQPVSLYPAQVSLQVLLTPGHRTGVGCLSARE